MKRVLSLALCLLFISGGLTAGAYSNFHEYIYNTAGESVPAPQTYAPVRVIYGDEDTGKVFSAPKDADTDGDGNLYILDSGNDRIVVYDAQLAFKTVLEAPSADGEQFSFTGCTGIFIRGDEIYLANKENGLIYVMDTGGAGRRVVRFQPLAVVDESFVFRPSRLTVDEAGIIQVQAEGCYNGLITLNADGGMIGYFSANTIQASLSVLAAQFWRKIFSEEQQNNIKQIIPVEYSSLTMDSEGFIYTTTKKTEDSTLEIKKLNPYGNNILGYDDSDSSVKIGNGNYGDLRVFHTEGQDKDTTFEDIYVDGDGFIFALDTTRGRVFSYDQSSNLIGIFGGIGDQTGTFSLPAAVCGSGDRIYVLDATKNSLTVFEANDYVRDIRKALLLDEACDYEQAMLYWERVYRENANYSLALSGLGKAAYEKGELKLALQYFEQADDRVNYDIAFAAYRTDFIRENFAWMGIALLAVIAVIYALVFYKRRKGRK